jgi:cytidylate kinase
VIIAIDGPAAAGKGTLAKAISKHLNFAYLETGLLYRAIGKKVLNEGKTQNKTALAESIAKNFQFEDIQTDGLQSEKVGQMASKISAIPNVRKSLLNFQREFAYNPPHGKSGAVLDGRDIGTVVCPRAQIKIFITASAEVRAKRRLKELQKQDPGVMYDNILKDLIERDARDQERAIAPLEPASDGTVLETSALNKGQVLELALKIISSKGYFKMAT